MTTPTLPTPPFQQVALCQIAHNGLQRKTTKDPAFRVLGVFQNQKTATKHFKRSVKKGQINPTLTFIVPLGETNVIPNAPGKSADYLAKKATRMVEENTVEAIGRRKAFQETLKTRKEQNKAGKRVSEPPAENNTVEEEEDSEEEEDDDDEVDRGAMVPNQNYTIVSVLIDQSQEREDAFSVYGSFDRVDTAQKFIENRLADHLPDLSLFVVEMYQWIYPIVSKDSERLEKIPFKYREDKLNAYMQPKTAEIEKVKQMYANQKEPEEDMPNGADEKK